MKNSWVKRIYTGTGDNRTTGIQGGIRLSKHSTRIEAIGSLDELNSFFGFLLALGDVSFKTKREKKIEKSFRKIIEQIQKDLFVIGADLSQTMIKNNSIPHPLRYHYPVPSDKYNNSIPKIDHNDIHRLEELTDHFQKRLPTLRNFIIPRGSPVGAFLHMIRAVCHSFLES